MYPIMLTLKNKDALTLTLTLSSAHLLGVLSELLRFLSLVTQHHQQRRIEDQGQRQPLEGDQQRGVAVVAEKKAQARSAQH